MKFTNLCGMTIPERMVALQDMMQELINAIYAEYRWIAKVSHVSETNVFTANEVVNFDDSDFYVGQTVIFTDGYLGVVVGVNNSVTPKQFTAGHYMQLKGDKGDNGINGTNGKNGLNSLAYNGVYVTTSVPSSVISFPTMASNFNRPPVVGDAFNIVFRGAGSVLNRSWLGTYKVISLGTGVANCSGSVVETTGKHGEAGTGTKVYIHNITIVMTAENRCCFQLFINSNTPISSASELGMRLSDNGFSAYATQSEMAYKSASGKWNSKQIIAVQGDNLAKSIRFIYIDGSNENAPADSITILDIVETVG
jgi:hypothetical protein